MKTKFHILLLLLFASSGIANSQQANKTILIEKLTSVSCGSCANGDLVLHDVMQAHPDAIAIAHHVSTTFDPMTKPESIELWKFYGNGTPSAMFDRNSGSVFTSSWDSKATSAEALEPITDIDIQFNYDESSRALNINLTAEFIDSSASGEYRFNCYLIEDSVTGGIKYSQGNYYNEVMGHPHYGLGQPIHGYVHNHVVRHYFGGAWGSDSSISSSIQMDTTYTYSYQFVLPDSFKQEHVSLVGIVQAYGPTLADRQIAAATKKTLGVMAGTPEVLQPAKISIHPNPSTGIFTLGFSPEFKSNRVIVQDFQGRIINRSAIRQGAASEIHLDISGCPDGVYLISVTDGIRSASKKLVLIR